MRNGRHLLEHLLIILQPEVQRITSLGIKIMPQSIPSPLMQRSDRVRYRRPRRRRSRIVQVSYMDGLVHPTQRIVDIPQRLPQTSTHHELQVSSYMGEVLPARGRLVRAIQGAETSADGVEFRYDGGDVHRGSWDMGEEAEDSPGDVLA